MIINSIKYSLLVTIFFISSSNAQQYGTIPDASRVGKGLDSLELDFAKRRYLEMLQTDDYKRSRKMAVAIQEKVGDLRVPMKDETIVHWLNENLKYTEYQSVPEAMEMICPYMDISAQLMRKYFDVYDLIGNATYDQAVEIIRPELFLTKKDLEFKE